MIILGVSAATTDTLIPFVSDFVHGNTKNNRSSNLKLEHLQYMMR